MFDDDFVPQRRSGNRQNYLNDRLHHLQEEGVIFAFRADQEYDEVANKSMGRRWRIWLTGDEDEFVWDQAPDCIFTTREGEAWLKGLDHGRFALSRSVAGSLVVEAMDEEFLAGMKSQFGVGNPSNHI
jgi:hypothetical protein